MADEQDTYRDYDWRPNTNDRCVICGKLVPEGRMVCPNCRERIMGDDEENSK